MRGKASIRFALLLSASVALWLPALSGVASAATIYVSGECWSPNFAVHLTPFNPANGQLTQVGLTITGEFDFDGMVYNPTEDPVLYFGEIDADFDVKVGFLASTSLDVRITEHGGSGPMHRRVSRIFRDPPR